MPDYSQLKVRAFDTPDLIAQKKRAAQKLKLLRQQLHEIPKSQLNYNLLLCTWNIREFDSSTYGDRIFESNYYIAEILSKFDIIAVQEVNKSLQGLKTVLSILGEKWKYIISDTTQGARGNDERIAYIYNSRKIQFGGLAGEMVIPPLEQKIDDPKKPGKKITQYIPFNQLWRTPLISGFSAGWAKFMLCNVHIKWGESESSRQEEINHIAEFLKNRAADKSAWARKLILLGDFNISSVVSDTYKLLNDAGYTSPIEHKDLKTTIGSKKHQYDRIFIKERNKKFQILQGGKIDLFQNLFTETEQLEYKSLVNKMDGTPAKSYTQWRTHQLSDHEPLWIEFKIEFEKEYLEGVIKENEA